MGKQIVAHQTAEAITVPGLNPGIPHGDQTWWEAGFTVLYILSSNIKNNYSTVYYFVSEIGK